MWTHHLQPTARHLAWLLAATAAGVLIAVSISPLIGPRPAAAAEQAETEPRTLAVSGTGRALLSPDLADVRVGIIVERARAREAQQVGAEIMTRVVDSLRDAGVAERDMATAWLSLQPVYDWSAEGKAHLTGYQLTNVVSVTVRDLTRIGEILDGAVDAGATSIDSISFRLTDHAAAEARVRNEAIADARARAEALATAAGVRVVRVLSISEGSSVTAPGQGRDDVGEAPTPVLPGRVELVAVVSVVYEID